jgi:hypothetical protein
MKQILNAFPLVLFTPNNIATMQSLFPDKILGGRGMDTRRKHKAKLGKKDEHNLNFSKGEILCYLSNVNEGKGAGPFTYPTNCIRDMGIFSHGKSSKTPYIDDVAHYLQPFMSPEIGDRVQDMFSAVYDIAFHKDWPNNPHKIRPVNIGTSPRRIVTVTGMLARHNKHLFSEHLLPYNFIAVRGGAQRRQCIMPCISNAIDMYFVLENNLWPEYYHQTKYSSPWTYW